MKKYIKIWQELARKNGWILSLGAWDRAETVVRLNGACPCLPEKRAHCPCPQLKEEMKRDGHCFCKLFFDPKKLKIKF